jgi:hypothetical protein
VTESKPQQGKSKDRFDQELALSTCRDGRRSKNVPWLPVTRLWLVLVWRRKETCPLVDVFDVLPRAFMRADFPNPQPLETSSAKTLKLRLARLARFVAQNSRCSSARDDGSHNGVRSHRFGLRSTIVKTRERSDSHQAVIKFESIQSRHVVQLQRQPELLRFRNGPDDVPRSESSGGRRELQPRVRRPADVVVDFARGCQEAGASRSAAARSVSRDRENHLAESPGEAEPHNLTSIVYFTF